MLKEHDLRAVFFVEPLFATRFGTDALQEIVGLIREYDQEIQLHLHTEWADESRTPLFPNIKQKRQHIKQFSFEEQKLLIEQGKQLLCNAIGEPINAFRAGSFGANNNTLKALKCNDIKFDSSYNFNYVNGICEIQTDRILTQPCLIEDVYEYPISFSGCNKKDARHMQISACSFREMRNALKQAYEQTWSAFVILSHNFELLNANKTARDPIAVKRFERLCSFLGDNRNLYTTKGFHQLKPQLPQSQGLYIEPKWVDSKIRLLEQVARRFF